MCSVIKRHGEGFTLYWKIPCVHIIFFSLLFIFISMILPYWLVLCIHLKAWRIHSFCQFSIIFFLRMIWNENHQQLLSRMTNEIFFYSLSQPILLFLFIFSVVSLTTVVHVEISFKLWISKTFIGMVSTRCRNQDRNSEK